MSNIFDEHAKKYGGIYFPPEGSHYKNLIDSAETLAASMIKQLCPNPDQIDLQIRWLKDARFNAYAMSYAGKHFIGIFLGSRSILQILFDRMMSNSECLPAVGNAAAEVRFLDQVEYRSNKERIYQPKCPIRADYATRLADLGFFWLFHHELGHLMNGHTQFVQESNQSPAIFEQILDDKENINYLDYLTLEMDADAFACVHFLCFIFRPQMDTASGKLIFHNQTMFGNKFDAMTILSLVIDSIFRFQSEGRNFLVRDVLKKDHPPNDYRRIYCGATIIEFNNIHDVMTVAELEACMEYATEIVERHFHVEQPYIDFDIEKSNYVGGLILDQILENWQVLRPKLDQFKLGGILAP